MTRQEWLDSLLVGADVALDYRSVGRGCKIYKVQEIVPFAKHPRAFVVNRRRFTANGELICDDDVVRWPGECCLENPDSKCLGWGEQPTRRQNSERWHVLDTLRKLEPSLNGFSTEKLIEMVRVFCPGYKPEW
jgi:hypothetical protein